MHLGKDNPTPYRCYAEFLENNDGSMRLQVLLSADTETWKVGMFTFQIRLREFDLEYSANGCEIFSDTILRFDETPHSQKIQIAYNSQSSHTEGTSTEVSAKLSQVPSAFAGAKAEQSKTLEDGWDRQTSYTSPTTSWMGDVKSGRWRFRPQIGTQHIVGTLFDHAKLFNFRASADCLPQLSVKVRPSGLSIGPSGNSRVAKAKSSILGVIVKRNATSISGDIEIEHRN